MKLFAAFLLLISLCRFACAAGTDEGHAAIKAHNKAMTESNAKDSGRKRQEAAFKKKQDAQTANSVRAQLGKAAEGKSDAEVVRMYEAKVKQDDKTKIDETAIRAKSDSQSRQVTGKSIQDLQNMSDADLDKTEAALMKQYGGKK